MDTETARASIDGGPITELLARLEAMAKRLDDQADEIARLKAAAPSVDSGVAAGAVARVTSRRGLLKGALAAGAAVSALAVSRAQPASAHDVDDIARNGATYSNNGAFFYNLSSTVLLPYLFQSANYTNSYPPLPDARFGLLGLVSGVDNVTKSRYGVCGAVDGVSPNAAVLGYATGAIGVQGYATTGIGVVGVSTSNYGLYGYSQNNSGLVGQSGGGGAAVAGVTTSGYGIFGGLTSPAAPGYAGYFDGPVFVRSLTVGGGPKSAAVKKRDGTSVRMYCQESPEPWFEDFGTADLKNGQAAVALDPEFDEVVDGNNYRVFLTEIGDCGGLFVSRKGPHNFEVRSRSGASANGTFDFRVVARRADPVGSRMEKVTVPTGQPLDVTKLPRRIEDLHVPGPSTDPRPVDKKPGQ